MDETKKDIAKELINDGWNAIKNNDAKKSQLANLYLSVHRQQPCCLDVLENFYKDLPNQLITSKSKIMKKNSEQKFQLKEGSVIYIPSMHAHISADTLTDEQAVLMLNENPNRIKHFAKFPADWESMKSGKKKKVEAPAAQPVVQPNPPAVVESSEPAAAATPEPASAPAPPTKAKAKTKSKAKPKVKK